MSDVLIDLIDLITLDDKQLLALYHAVKDGPSVRAEIVLPTGKITVYRVGANLIRIDVLRK